MWLMATEPERSPLDEVLDDEVEGIFKADPEFKQSLRRTVERVRNREAKLHPNEEVQRRLRKLGVPVEEPGQSSPPEPSI
jgi:hypothetical protein